MTGQMGDVNPLGNQKPGVVRDPRQPRAARRNAPADKGVARLGLPGRRPEQEGAQESAARIADQVLEVFSDRVAQPQVVMLRDQALEDRPFVGLCIHRADR